MNLTIQEIERNIRHHSRPEAPKWFIVVSKEGHPLMYHPGDNTFIPAPWYKASLFTMLNIPGVVSTAQEMMGLDVRGVSVVDYLDQLRDKLVREERARAREVIHG